MTEVFRDVMIEHDLADLITELKFQNLTGFVDHDKGEIASIDVALLHKRFDQIVQGCRAPIPAKLLNLYESLKTRLEHELFTAKPKKVRRESEDFRLLRDMAYQRAQVRLRERKRSDRGSQPRAFSLFFFSMSERRWSDV